MATRRTVESWANLKPDYRKRLENKGVTREQYLSGANLQAARGQRKEAERSRARREQSLPGASTVREWRARARRRGVTAGDWNAAVREAGPARFETVKDAVRGLEARHRAWVNAGQPRRYKTKIETQEERKKANSVGKALASIPPLVVPPREYVYDDEDDSYYSPDYIADHEEEFDTEGLIYEEYEPDPSEQWGESWGFYH